MVLHWLPTSARPLVTRLTNIRLKKVHRETCVFLHARERVGAAIGLIAAEVDLHYTTKQEKTDRQADHQFDDGQDALRMQTCAHAQNPVWNTTSPTSSVADADPSASAAALERMRPRLSSHEMVMVTLSFAARVTVPVAPSPKLRTMVVSQEVR